MKGRCVGTERTLQSGGGIEGGEGDGGGETGDHVGKLRGMMIGTRSWQAYGNCVASLNALALVGSVSTRFVFPLRDTTSRYSVDAGLGLLKTGTLQDMREEYSRSHQSVGVVPVGDKVTGDR